VIAACGADLIVHGHEHRCMEETLATPTGTVSVRGVASGTYEHGDPERSARYRVYEISAGGIRSDGVRVWDREHGRFQAV
jgi:hypothetical protein